MMTWNWKHYWRKRGSTLVRARYPSLDSKPLTRPMSDTGSYSHLVRVYTIVPIASFLTWLLLASVPPLIWPTHAPEAPHAPYFPTPLPELLLSISLFTLSHLLSPYLFALAGALLPHPTATSVLGTALHVVLRNALRTAALPILAIPGGRAATFRTPEFRRVWWLALGWSLAEVAAGIAQGYETLALYRDVLVPEGDARQLVASAVVGFPPTTWQQQQQQQPQKNDGSDSASPPRAADERLRESLSRGEDGAGSRPGEVAAFSSSSPPPLVRGRQLLPLSSSSREAWTAAHDAEIRLEVDKDFDELVAVKAREELEELYGFPAIVSRRRLYGSDPPRLSVITDCLFFCFFLSFLGNCSACLCSCRVCCGSRRYSCHSASRWSSRRVTSHRHSRCPQKPKTNWNWRRRSFRPVGRTVCSGARSWACVPSIGASPYCTLPSSCRAWACTSWHTSGCWWAWGCSSPGWPCGTHYREKTEGRGPSPVLGSLFCKMEF